MTTLFAFFLLSEHIAEPLALQLLLPCNPCTLLLLHLPKLFFHVCHDYSLPPNFLKPQFSSHNMWFNVIKLQCNATSTLFTFVRGPHMEICQYDNAKQIQELVWSSSFPFDLISCPKFACCRCACLIPYIQR